jgi:hypothetical protein
MTPRNNKNRSGNLATDTHKWGARSLLNVAFSVSGFSNFTSSMFSRRSENAWNLIPVFIKSHTPSGAWTGKLADKCSFNLHFQSYASCTTLDNSGPLPAIVNAVVLTCGTHSRLGRPTRLQRAKDKGGLLKRVAHWRPCGSTEDQYLEATSAVHKNIQEVRRGGEC